MNNTEDPVLQHLRENYRDYTYDMFMTNMSAEPEEIDLFGNWVDILQQEKLYSFESARDSAQKTEIDLERDSGERLHLINMSSYNYLGLGYHPEVIKAAQDAVAQYGLGAASSPILSGTYKIHKQFEKQLIEFFGMPDHSVSLFSSGYAVNLGVISAFTKPGSHLVLDKSVHMSILEGAKLAGAKISYFRHNDMIHLEKTLKKVCDGFNRVLICIEGVYSGDGDYGNVKDTVRLAKKYEAYTLVDEAHSALLAGENGRGVCEEQGVLADVDLYVMTFSKAFGGVGGALWAKNNICQYVNWYAKCRMFSCALDPAVTGGMLKVVQLAASEEGHRRRMRLQENANYLSSLLRGKVDLGKSESWILTVLYGKDTNTLNVANALQREGLDTSLIQFPAVKKNEAKIRLFVTSEHTKEQLDKAAIVLLEVAEQYNFLLA